MAQRQLRPELYFPKFFKSRAQVKYLFTVYICSEKQKCKNEIKKNIHIPTKRSKIQKILLTTQIIPQNIANTKTKNTFCSDMFC